MIAEFTLKTDRDLTRLAFAMNRVEFRSNPAVLGSNRGFTPLLVSSLWRCGDLPRDKVDTYTAGCPHEPKLLFSTISSAAASKFGASGCKIVDNTKQRIEKA